MPDLDFTGLIVGAAFLAVLAIAAVIAVGVSWLGHPTAALWITGIGAGLGYGAAKLMRAAVG